MSQRNDGNSGTRTSLIFKTELREYFPGTIKVMVRSLKAYHQKLKKRARLHLVATNGVVVNNVDISGTAKELYLTQEQGFTMENACAVVQQHMESKNLKYLFTEKKINKRSILTDLRTEIDGLNGTVQKKDAVIALLKREITQLRDKLDVTKNDDHDGKTRDYCGKTYTRDLDKVGHNIERVKNRHNADSCKIARDALQRASKRSKDGTKMVMLSHEEHRKLKNSEFLTKHFVSCAQYLKKQRGDDNSRIATQVLYTLVAPSESERKRGDINIVANVLGIDRKNESMTKARLRKEKIVEYEKRNAATAYKIGDSVKTLRGWGRVVSVNQDEQLEVQHKIHSNLFETSVYSKYEVSPKDRPCQVGDLVRSSRFGRAEIVEMDDKVMKLSIFTSRGTRTVRQIAIQGEEDDLVVLPPLLFEPCRKVRSDRISRETLKAIESYFVMVCPESPCMRDQLVHYVSRGVKESRAAIIQSDTLENLYKGFVQRYPQHEICLRTFERHRPWFLRKAQRQTCVCNYCLEFRGYFDVFSDLKLRSALERIHASLEDSSRGKILLRNIIDLCTKKTSLDLCASLCCDGVFDKKQSCPCVAKKLKHRCKNCDARKLSTIWSELRDIVVLDDGSFPSLWKEIVTWICLQTIELGTTKKKKKNERHSQIRVSGTIVQFFDQFVEIVDTYISHRFNRLVQKSSAAEQLRHLWLNELILTWDFAENYGMLQKIQIQQDYYSTPSTTLFIGITLRLDATVWLTGNVEIGDEVSILSSRKFGTVQSIDSDGVYNVELCDGSTRSCMRDEIGLRRIITDARIGVSDDKAHDAVFVDVYMNAFFKDLRKSEWGQNIDVLRIRSDNAPQHFKSSESMFNFSTWKSRFELRILTWSFGTPKHGKGVRIHFTLSKLQH
jgi:hypothetical protein